MSSVVVDAATETITDDPVTPGRAPLRRLGRLALIIFVVGAVAAIGAGGRAMYTYPAPSWSGGGVYYDGDDVILMSPPFGRGAVLVPAAAGKQFSFGMTLTNTGERTIEVTNLAPHKLHILASGRVRVGPAGPENWGSLPPKGPSGNFRPFTLRPDEARFVLWEYRFREDCDFSTELSSVVQGNRVSPRSGGRGWQAQKVEFEVSGRYRSEPLELAKEIFIEGGNALCGDRRSPNLNPV